MTPDRTLPDREAARAGATAAYLTRRQRALRDVPSLPTPPEQRRVTDFPAVPVLPHPGARPGTDLLPRREPDLGKAG